MHRFISLLLLASAAYAADAIYINGNVITVDPSKPYAEAFAVTNGRFSAVGTTAEMRRLATPATKIVDLKGMTVTPGFNDVHLHPTGRLRRRVRRTTCRGWDRKRSTTWMS